MKDNVVRKSHCCFIGFNVSDYISIRTSNLFMCTQNKSRDKITCSLIKDLFVI